MTVKTKTITFESIMKNFKNFVAKPTTRPVLNHVYFDGTHLIATDSHKLLKVNASYIDNMPSEEPFFYNPKTNEIVDINKFNYPNVNRLIPDYYKSLIIFDNNIKEFEQHVKEAKKIVKNVKNNIVKYNFTNNNTTIKADNKNSESYDETIESVFVKDGEDTNIATSGIYMTQSITVMKRLSKLTNDNIELKLNGSIRPMAFSQSDVFDLVLMPIRVQ